MSISQQIPGVTATSTDSVDTRFPLPSYTGGTPLPLVSALVYPLGSGDASSEVHFAPDAPYTPLPASGVMSHPGISPQEQHPPAISGTLTVDNLPDGAVVTCDESSTAVYAANGAYQLRIIYEMDGQNTFSGKITHTYTQVIGLTVTLPPPPSVPPSPIASCALAEDAHGRPVLLTANGFQPANVSGGGTPATSINGLVSSDAGRSYLLSGLSDIYSPTSQANYGADCPSLLIDRRTNHYRAIYCRTSAAGSGQAAAAQILMQTGVMADVFTSRAPFASYTGPDPNALPSLSGGLCAAIQHPTDADYALLVYSDTGTPTAPGSHALKAAFSTDAGATWQPMPRAVVPALDLTLTGRPALCWSGSDLILVYSQGTQLYSMTSGDRGQTWRAAGMVSVYTPITSSGSSSGGLAYFCLSMAAHDGQVYLLAFVGNTQQNRPGLRVPAQTSPRLFASGDLGRNWTLRAAETPTSTSAPPEFALAPPGVLPAICAPSGIGISPETGLLRLDTQKVSHDGGLTWTAP